MLPLAEFAKANEGPRDRPEEVRGRSEEAAGRASEESRRGAQAAAGEPAGWPDEIAAAIIRENRRATGAPYFLAQCAREVRPHDAPDCHGRRNGSLRWAPVRSASRAPRAEKISPRPVQTLSTGAHRQQALRVFAMDEGLRPGQEQSDSAAICLTVLEVKRHAGPFAAGAALIEGATTRPSFALRCRPTSSETQARASRWTATKPLAARFVGCTAGALPISRLAPNSLRGCAAARCCTWRGTGAKGQGVTLDASTAACRFRRRERWPAGHAAVGTLEMLVRRQFSRCSFGR